MDISKRNNISFPLLRGFRFSLLFFFRFFLNYYLYIYVIIYFLCLFADLVFTAFIVLEVSSMCRKPIAT